MAPPAGAGISCSLPLGMRQARNRALLRNNKKTTSAFFRSIRVLRVPPSVDVACPSGSFIRRPSLNYLPRQVVESAAEEEADRQVPPLFALKLRDEIGRSHIERHAGGEGETVLLEDRELLC